MNIQVFKYDDVEIEFDLRQGKNMMVNATEMAKIFGKLPKDFLRNDDVQSFINECLKKENSPFLGVQTLDDLVVSKQKSGTWMHEVLALKFASWLSPKFELWVYITIRNLLYEFAYEIEDSIKESVMLQKKQDDLKNKLAKNNPDFLEYLTVQQQIINSKNRRRAATIDKFRETATLFYANDKEIN